MKTPAAAAKARDGVEHADKRRRRQRSNEPGGRRGVGSRLSSDDDEPMKVWMEEAMRDDTLRAEMTENAMTFWRGRMT